MSWNYRVVRRHLPPPEDHDWYAIHEAYYDKAGKIYAITEKPCTIEGESVQELNGIRLRMLEASKQPVVEWDDVVGKRRKPRKA